MPALVDARDHRRMVDGAHPPRRLRRLPPVRPDPGQPRHLVEPAHDSAETTRQRGHLVQAALRGPSTPLRLCAHGSRPFLAPGAGRARGPGQQPFGPSRRAAWCSSMSTVASRSTRSSSTVPPVDRSTGPTSCSQRGRPPAGPLSIATATQPHNGLRAERLAKSTANDARANAELRRESGGARTRPSARRSTARRATVAVMKGARS